MLITLIASLSIFGIGSGLFSIEISKISYINSISPQFKTTKSEFNVKMQDNLLIDTNTHYEYVIDNTLDNYKKCDIMIESIYELLMLNKLMIENDEFVNNKVR